MASIFDPNAQHDQVRFKIIAGLDRISQALRSMMWEQGKTLGLTPIQMQCLVFLNYHSDKKRRAGQLAREFDVTPATVSQAISILIKKGFILILKYPVPHIPGFPLKALRQYRHHRHALFAGQLPSFYQSQGLFVQALIDND